MDHLDKVSGAVRTHSRAAGLTIGFGCDGVQRTFQHFPGFFAAACHERGTVERAFLPAGDAEPHIFHAPFFQLFGAALGVTVETVSGIDDDIAGDQMRLHVADEVIHGLSGTDQHEDLAGMFEHAEKFRNTGSRLEIFIFPGSVHEIFQFFFGAVVEGNLIAFGFKIQCQICPHYGKSGDPDICLDTHVSSSSGYSFGLSCLIIRCNIA